MLSVKIYRAALAPTLISPVFHEDIMYDLPEELLLAILSNLGLEDIAKLRCAGTMLSTRIKCFVLRPSLDSMYRRGQRFRKICKDRILPVP